MNERKRSSFCFLILAVVQLLSRDQLCDSMDSSTPGSPVLYRLPEFAQQTHVESVMPSHHLILCCPLLPSPSLFPASGTFPESALHMRWSNRQLLSSLKEVTFALLAVKRTGGIGKAEFDEAGNGKFSRGDHRTPGYIQEQGCSFKPPVRKFGEGRGDQAGRVSSTGPHRPVIRGHQGTDRTHEHLQCTRSRSDRSSPSPIQVPPASRCQRPPGGAGPSDKRRNQSTSCHTRADPGDGSRARLSMFLPLRPLQPQKPYKQQLHPACRLTQDKTS